MIRNTIILMILFLAASYNLMAQVSDINICNHRNKKVPISDIKKIISQNITVKDFLLDSTANARVMADQLRCLTKTDIDSNYIVREGKTSNASAFKKGNIKYIIYDRDYLEASNDIMAAYGILAHELAHHVYGPAWLGNQGKRNLQERWNAELAADSFAAALLLKMGASKQSALKMFDGVEEDSSDTHPSKWRRIEMVKKVWLDNVAYQSDPKKVGYIMNCATLNSSCNPDMYKIDYIPGKKNWKGTQFEVCIISVDTNIEKVIYYFHPSFNKCVDTSYAKEANFICNPRTDSRGSFEMRASIYIKEQGQCIVTQNIDIIALPNTEVKGGVNLGH